MTILCKTRLALKLALALWAGKMSYNNIMVNLGEALPNKNHESNTKNRIRSQYQLAYDSSFGFFDDIPEQQWRRQQSLSLREKDHRHPGEHGATVFWGKPALWYYHNYDPIFHCQLATRVGGRGDGGKWLCDPERITRVSQQRVPEQGCLVYSIGSRGEYDFEDGLVATLGNDACEYHVFDFSGDFDRPENADKKIHFHKWGLVGSKEGNKSSEGEFYSFPEIVKKLGHEDRIIDVFKIDCEGCEFTTYQDWIGNQNLRQILVETHSLPQGNKKKMGLAYFDSFKANGLAMYSKEANGYDGGNSYEFSYIRLSGDYFK